MKELVIRFLVGGVIVSAFATISDILKPKSFAGLFGAAPSVALATLALTLAQKDPFYVAMEGRSMMLGAVAFGIYAFCVSHFLLHSKTGTIRLAAGFIVLWLVVAFSLWAGFVR